MRTLKLLLPVVILVVCMSVLKANTIHVPADSSTIKAGINGAVDGDTVLVADGAYTGANNKSLDFLGKAIMVMSENGPENCVIDCEGIGRGFYFHNGEDSNSIIKGFTITNGWDVLRGGGINCWDCSPTITGNTITDCEAEDGGGIYVNCESSAEPTIVGNTISGNTATGNSGRGGGIWCGMGCSPTITNTILMGNTPDGIYDSDFGSPTVNYSNIQGGWEGYGNINRFPRFVLRNKQDYRLRWESPCIDTGDPNLFDPDGTRSDMGAHYFNQNDYLTLYVTPDITEVAQGGQLGITYTAINRWNQPEPFWLGSRVLLPGGAVLDVVGPEQHTLPANYTTQVHITHDIRQAAPAGVYKYRSAVGLPPSTIYDWDSFTFKVNE